MPENPNPITIDNSVVILIDHQPWVAFSVQSIDTTLLVNNVAALFRVGAFGRHAEEPAVRAPERDVAPASGSAPP